MAVNIKTGKILLEVDSPINRLITESEDLSDAEKLLKRRPKAIKSK